MGELRDGSATRWDLDRMFRRDGFRCPFTDGVSFADVDFEIERHGHFLVLEGKRSGQYLSTGQARAMQARLLTGRTCVVFWGDPDAGVVTHIGYYRRYFRGSRAYECVKVPATNETLWRICTDWWMWADGQAWPDATECGFDTAPSLIPSGIAI